MIYLITWNFNRENPTRYEQKRKEMFNRISKLDNAYEGNLDTVCFLDSTSNHEELYSYFVTGLFDHADDRIFITHIPKDLYTGWMNKDVNSWLAARS